MLQSGDFDKTVWTTLRPLPQVSYYIRITSMLVQIGFQDQSSPKYHASVPVTHQASSCIEQNLWLYSTCLADKTLFLLQVHFDCVYKTLTVVSSRSSKLLGGNRVIAQVSPQTPPLFGKRLVTKPNRGSVVWTILPKLTSGLSFVSILAA